MADKDWLQNLIMQIQAESREVLGPSGWRVPQAQVLPKKAAHLEPYNNEPNSLFVDSDSFSLQVATDSKILFPARLNVLLPMINLFCCANNR